jgi:hypothetical protein
MARGRYQDRDTKGRRIAIPQIVAREAQARAAASGNQDAEGVPFDPSGLFIISTDVQDAIERLANEVDALRAANSQIATENERRSCVSLPWGWGGEPVPDGTIDAADRAAIAGCYHGFTY